MLEIIINGEHLDLPKNVSLDIEDTNPIFNDRGAQSLPLTVPPTAKNRRLLSFPDLLHNADAANAPMKSAKVVCKSYQRSGSVNITSASRSQGVTFNLGFDNSTAYEKWQNKKLAELSGLPVISKPVPQLLEWLRSRDCQQPEDEGLALFEVIVSKKESPDSSSDKTYVYERLNDTAALHNDKGACPFYQIVNNKLTEVSAPAGYGVSPFLYVWRLLELAFADLGVTITENPMKDNSDLRRLVVLNNTMDGVATGMLDYAELMPDCTVAELMNALWVRFGLTYVVNSETRTVRLRLIKDILNDSSAHDFDEQITALETITCETPKYVRLTAGTSFEGAAPPCARYEDFAETANPIVYAGVKPASWVQDDAATWLRCGNPNVTEAFCCEIGSGIWYRFDLRNMKTKACGSSFFDWDPQPEDCEAFELSSLDECVPVVYLTSDSQDPAVSKVLFSNFYPLYLCGSRHRHSFIQGEDSDSSSEQPTSPLSFIFAYLRDGRAVGRIAPEVEEFEDFEGETPRVSLYFQFKDGLFANFWKEYDEFLRHSNRTAEVSARLPLSTIMSIDVLEPVRLRSVPCLIDTLKYSLPVGVNAAVDVTLRAIQPQGNYDITAEQMTAPINWSTGRLEWLLISTNIDAVRASVSNEDVIRNFKEQTGYRDYYDDNHVYHYLSAQLSVSFKAVGGETEWIDNPPSESPSTNLSLNIVGKHFDVRIIYEIYEVIETGSSPYELSIAPGGGDFSYAPPLQFIARYAPVWVTD